MKISLVQCLSKKGAVSENIENHLKLIRRSLEYEADLVVFPELSLTNYEPTLAAELAFETNDDRLDVFQEESDRGNVTICLGLPVRRTSGIHIGMLTFQPEKERELYTKQMLHEDERPYFSCGDRDFYLKKDDFTIAFGICYESLQRTHILKAIGNGANLYIASVAKPAGGVSRALETFPSIAEEFNMPVFMANSVGISDTFMATGTSAAWNASGQLVHCLNESDQGILLYDTLSQETKSIYIS